MRPDLFISILLCLFPQARGGALDTVLGPLPGESAPAKQPTPTLLESFISSQQARDTADSKRREAAFQPKAKIKPRERSETTISGFAAAAEFGKGITSQDTNSLINSILPTGWGESTDDEPKTEEPTLGPRPFSNYKKVGNQYIKN